MIDDDIDASESLVRVKKKSIKSFFPYFYIFQELQELASQVVGIDRYHQVLKNSFSLVYSPPVTSI